MTRESYRRYLLTPHWRGVRRRYADRFRCCEVCGSTVRLDTHHLSYRHLWREEWPDLARLCHRCHVKVHENGANSSNIRRVLASRPPQAGAMAGGTSRLAWLLSLLGGPDRAR